VASYSLVHLAQRWDDESDVNLYHCETTNLSSN
jgi:hypothetical protein